MSRLKELIGKLCPDGVEYVELGRVCDIKTGKGVTKKDATEVGEYPIISGGIEPLSNYNTYNREANTVTIARAGGAGYVNYITTKFYLNDKCFSVVPKTEFSARIETRFLYFYLKSIEQEIMRMKSTGSVPTVNTQKVSSIRIPLPPLEIQKEIVKILDKFTEYDTELQSELQDRIKQYEYYRDKLLSFPEKK